MPTFKSDTYPLRFYRGYRTSFDAVVEGIDKLSAHYGKFNKEDLLNRIMIADNNKLVTITEPSHQEIEEYIYRNTLDKKPEDFVRISYFSEYGALSHDFRDNYGELLQSLEREGYVDGTEFDFECLQELHSFQRNIECIPHKMMLDKGEIDYRVYLERIKPIGERYTPLIDKQKREQKLGEFSRVRKMFGSSSKLEFCCYKCLAVVEPHDAKFVVTEYLEDGKIKQHKCMYDSEFDAWEKLSRSTCSPAPGALKVWLRSPYIKRQKELEERGAQHAPGDETKLYEDVEAINAKYEPLIDKFEMGLERIADKNYLDHVNLIIGQSKSHDLAFSVN